MTKKDLEKLQKNEAAETPEETKEETTPETSPDTDSTEEPETPEETTEEPAGETPAEDTAETTPESEPKAAETTPPKEAKSEDKFSDGMTDAVKAMFGALANTLVAQQNEIRELRNQVESIPNDRSLRLTNQFQETKAEKKTGSLLNFLRSSGVEV